MKLTSVIAVLVGLAFTQAVTAYTRFSEYGSVFPPVTPAGMFKSLEIETQWFENYVDHFSPQDTRKFQQRWFENREFFDAAADAKSKAPVFVYIGSEGQLSANWVTSGLMHTYGKEHGALLVALEHRYYGQSQPMADHSVENLRYLTSEQALEDLSTFIRWYVNKKVTWGRERPVIVFGGSYGATLAATMRARHPHLVRGAVASSAPFEPEVNFPQYYEVATEALRFFGGDECVQRFDLVRQIMATHLTSSIGRDEISRKLNTCTPITPANFIGINTQAFWTSVTDNLAGVVQYNKEGSNRLSLGEVCKRMINSQGFYDEYFAIFKEARGKDGDNCFKWTYSEMLADLTSTKIVASNNMRQWIYQTCTEWGFYQTLQSDKQVYGPKDAVTIDLFVKLCQDAYSPKFTKSYIMEAADRTRDAYGGWYFQATNVALANGNIDPWHIISLFEKCGKREPTITIHFSPGTSHCALLYPEQPYDFDSVKQARIEVGEQVALWVKTKY